MTSQRVPCNQLTGEEKTEAWFTDVSAPYTGVLQRCRAAEPEPFLETSLKDGGKEVFPGGRTLNSAPGGLLWKEKCPDVQLYANLWAVANGSLDGQGVRRRMIGKLVTKKFGEIFLD